MTLEKACDQYYFYSGKASDIARQLALAGIAIVWVFSTDAAGNHKVPRALLTPAVAIVATLALDFLQYGYAALAWGFYHRWKEKRVDVNEDFYAPRPINWPTVAFFWSKLAAVTFAYAMLLRFLLRSV